MKKIILTLTVVFSFMTSTQAFAFITVIDVHELAGQVTTIQNGSDYSLDQMDKKFLSYRGQPAEAVSLFELIVHNYVPLANVDAEVNNETGTISATVSVNGYLGFEYFYFIIKQSGN